jgi:hypothetical protein
VPKKKIAIIQSNYIPWKGYFDIINKVDEFILYDEVQYTKRDWRNRNQIKTQNGLQWLTIPVEVKGKYDQRIDETRVADKSFAIKHWNTIKHAYSKAPCFKEYSDKFEKLYSELDEDLLSKVNHKFITEICAILNINTRISWSTDYEALAEEKQKESANNRLIDLCLKSGASIYLSGPAAKDYMDVDLFNKQGIEVEWMDYSHYKEYNQLYGEFTHYVSALDLIFSVGTEAKMHVKI